MRSFKTLLTVIGAVTVLVLAGNTVAFAATGHSFILGKVNKANKATTLKRTTNGPALTLVARPPSSAPFAVNTNGKVTNLNADTVDGLDSSAFAPSSLVSNTPIARGFVSTGAGGTAPSLATGSTGVSAVSWDGTGYVLTVTGQDYGYSRFATVITGTCDGGVVPSTSSVSGNLLVHFNAGVVCQPGGFAYVIYKLG